MPLRKLRESDTQAIAAGRVLRELVDQIEDLAHQKAPYATSSSFECALPSPTPVKKSIVLLRTALISGDPTLRPARENNRLI